MKILAIVGSPRSGGNTSYLVDVTLQEAAKQGLETEKIVLSKYNVNPCQGHENCSAFSECPQKDDAAWILEEFRRAEGIVLASPVYFMSLSAQMKAFVDRNNFLYKHHQNIKARCAALISVSAWDGTEEVIRTLAQFIKFSNQGTRIFSITGHADKPGAIKHQSETVRKTREIGNQMAEVLNAHRI